MLVVIWGFDLALTFRAHRVINTSLLAWGVVMHSINLIGHLLSADVFDHAVDAASAGLGA